MPNTNNFPMVFRFNDPPGRKGRLCRQVTLSRVVRKGDGSIIPNAGTELVPLVFEDGVTLTASRSAIVLAASKPGRQVIARVRRGDVCPRDQERLRAAKGPLPRAEPPAT